jgi:hypothetical protein
VREVPVDAFGPISLYNSLFRKNKRTRTKSPRPAPTTAPSAFISAVVKTIGLMPADHGRLELPHPGCTVPTRDPGRILDVPPANGPTTLAWKSPARSGAGIEWPSRIGFSIGPGSRTSVQISIRSTYLFHLIVLSQATQPWDGCRYERDRPGVSPTS